MGDRRSRGDDISNWRRGSTSYEPSESVASSSSAGSRPQQPPGSVWGLPEHRPAQTPTTPTERPTRWGPPGGTRRPAGQSFTSHGQPPISPTTSRAPRPSPATERTFFASESPATLDPRLSDAAQNALVSSFSNLRLKGKFPHRPGWGSEGAPALMRTNHFNITYPNTRLYDYSVKIEPRPTIRRIRRRLFQLLEDAPAFAPFKSHVVHDSGGRIISSRILPIPPTGVVIHIRHYDSDEDGPNERSMTYLMTIAFNTQLDTDHLNRYPLCPWKKFSEY